MRYKMDRRSSPIHSNMTLITEIFIYMSPLSGLFIWISRQRFFLDKQTNDCTLYKNINDVWVGNWN